MKKRPTGRKPASAHGCAGMFVTTTRNRRASDSIANIFFETISHHRLPRQHRLPRLRLRDRDLPQEDQLDRPHPSAAWITAQWVRLDPAGHLPAKDTNAQICMGCRHTMGMLHLRILSPSLLTQDVLGCVVDNPAVSGIAVTRNASVEPVGDLVVADVATRRPNSTGPTSVS